MPDHSGHRSAGGLAFLRHWPGVMRTPTPFSDSGPIASGRRNCRRLGLGSKHHADRIERVRVTDELDGAAQRKVFVIHGRNDAARRGVFAFLRSIGLGPIEWSRAIAMTGKGSPYIGDVLDVAFSQAQSVVVLQTPDTVAHLHESFTYTGDPDTSPQMQPRPTVLFEAGMALARGEDRTIIVAEQRRPQ